MACFGALFCVAAVDVVKNRFELPSAKVTIKVVDESNATLAGAKVSLGFRDRLSKEDTIFRGETNAAGLLMAEGGCAVDGLSNQVTKAGYYDGWVDIPIFRDVDALNRWQPWNGTYTTVLRKIENPIAMYARKVSAEIPMANQPCGFDLMEADWVTPYGHGKTADLVVILTGRRLDSWLDYDVSATVGFSNRLDGLQEIILPHTYSTSGFKWPRQAPESGYQAPFSARASWFPQGSGKQPIRTFKDDQAYFFRVRTAESNGQIVSALYGKISGGIILEPREAKLCKIVFQYYLNPTSLDRNMEWDPKRNLLKGLNYEETPRDP